MYGCVRVCTGGERVVYGWVYGVRFQCFQCKDFILEYPPPRIPPLVTGSIPSAASNLPTRVRCYIFSVNMVSLYIDYSSTTNSHLRRASRRVMMSRHTRSFPAIVTGFTCANCSGIRVLKRPGERGEG